MSDPDKRAGLRLRPFSEGDFNRLISWVPDAASLSQWCAGFFKHPLSDDQLTRYLESAKQPLTREIFVAETTAAEAVGHVELSMLWPHLSCRLSRVLVDPGRRRERFGSELVTLALDHAFRDYAVAHVDLGVSKNNAGAIGFYERLGFAWVGTWPNAIATSTGTLTVYWMTLTRDAWGRLGPLSN
jgi:RimJ/RimL family protein N-acetyltransferase